MKTFTPWNVLTLMVLVDRVKRARGFAGGVYNAEPEKKAKQFAEHWGATGCTSLRDMVDPICPGYGFSLCTADPVDVSGYKEMLWQNDEYNEGFLASHHGIVKVELVTRGSFIVPCQNSYGLFRLANKDICSNVCLFRTIPRPVVKTSAAKTTVQKAGADIHVTGAPPSVNFNFEI
ncbi:unnamed protein product [Peronospora belbahrii]|uniref:Uncharacterized protein n=1 Tax=Peronospora belbahrii TaxID=622444 RepID=A0ABN8D6B8_9STRA|nr:unnamed protein product [Peronospora belbahrii]